MARPGDDDRPVRTLARAAKAKMARLRGELDERIELIHRRKARIAEDFFDIAVALAEIDGGKLYAADGCTSVGQLVEKRELFSAETARKLVALIRSGVTREDALVLGGIERAFAASRLAKAMGRTVRGLLAVGDPVGDKPLTDATTAEMDAETAKLTKKTRGRGHPKGLVVEMKAAQAAGRALQTVLDEAGLEGVVAKAVRRRAGARVAVELTAEAAAALRTLVVGEAPRSEAPGKRSKEPGKRSKEPGKRSKEPGKPR